MTRDGVEAGRGHITVGLNDNTKKGLRKMRANLNKWAATTAKAAALVVGPLLAAGKLFSSTGDKLDKMSKRTEVSVERLSELSFVASQSGTDIDQLSNAIFRASRRIGNATQETGPAARALKLLNQEAGDLASMNVDEQFLAIVDALNNFDDAFRSQAGFEIFGDQWRQIKPLVDGGVEGIEKLSQKARELGLVWSTEMAQDAAKLTDKMDVVNKQFQMVIVKVGEGVLPLMHALLNDLGPLIKRTGEWIKENKELLEWIGKIGAAVGIASLAMKGLAVVNPFTAAIAGAITLLSYQNDVIKFLDKMAGFKFDGSVKKGEKGYAENLARLAKDPKWKKMGEAMAKTDKVIEDAKKKNKPENKAASQAYEEIIGGGSRRAVQLLRQGTSQIADNLRAGSALLAGNLQLAFGGETSRFDPRTTTIGGFGAGFGATTGTVRRPEETQEEILASEMRQEDLLLRIARATDFFKGNQ